MNKFIGKGRREIDLEEIYKIICIVLLYPDSGYGGCSFWKHIINNYGTNFFDSNNPECIRNRWRKIEREHLVDFMEYKMKLERQIGEDCAKKIQFAVGMDYMSEDKLRISGAMILEKLKSSKKFHKKYNHIIKPAKCVKQKAIQSKPENLEDYPCRAGYCNEVACPAVAGPKQNYGEFSSLLDLNCLTKFPKKSLETLTEKLDLKFHDKEKISNIFSTLIEKAKKVEYSVFSAPDNPDCEKPNMGWTHLEDVMLSHYTTYIKHLQKSKTTEAIKNRQFLLQLI